MSEENSNKDQNKDQNKRQSESQNDQQNRKIGKVSGIHGLKGELYVHVFSKDISWIDRLETLVLESPKGVKTSHAVKSLRPFKDGFLVYIDEVNDRTKAEEFRAHLVYVSPDLFVSDEGDESFYLLEIEGFRVFDKSVELGRIVGFSSNGIQDLLVVELESGARPEIPLVEDFILEIQFEKGEIHMDLPAGLIEAQQVGKK